MCRGTLLQCDSEITNQFNFISQAVARAWVVTLQLGQRTVWKSKPGERTKGQTQFGTYTTSVFGKILQWILECLYVWESGNEPEIGWASITGHYSWSSWCHTTFLIPLAWEQVSLGVHIGNLWWELGQKCHLHRPRSILRASTAPNSQGIACNDPVPFSWVTSLQGKPDHPLLVHPSLRSKQVPLSKRRHSRFEYVMMHGNMCDYCMYDCENFYR